MQDRAEIGRLAADGDGLTEKPWLQPGRAQRADRRVDLPRLAHHIDGNCHGNCPPAGDLGRGQVKNGRGCAG